MKVKVWPQHGRSPVLKFIKKQAPEHRARIMKDIEFFEEQGLELLAVPSKLKKLKGYAELYELIVDFKGIFYRIIFTVVDGEAWLLEAFKKKDNNTRKTYIANAASRRETLLLALA